MVTWCGSDQWNHPRMCELHVIRTGSSVKPVTPFTSLVQKPPQMVFLWDLHYLAAAQYSDSTWTAPVWTGHCTQQGFQVEDCSLTLTHTHHCSSYLDGTTNIYRFPFQTWAQSHTNCIASPSESLQLVYRYLEKYVKIGSIISKQCGSDSTSIYLSILYFIHGHIFRSELPKS